MSEPGDVAAHPYRRPTRRPLRIFALDPMRIRRGALGHVTPRATLQVPFEDDLLPGPRGRRIRVVDFDGVHKCFYAPVDLGHPDVLISAGLAPSETDPRFHQQMVYAVVANLWADFETALGRRVSLGRRSFLTIVPHAFYGANAYYDPDSSALHFGYFRADEKDPGGNLPGQMVYSCLSHDIIVHETTHALVDRLRPHFLIDSNPDVAAFHEGFADLVAIFQHFKLREVLVPALAEARGRLDEAEGLLDLARQFGFATGGGAALRSAAPGAPDPARYTNATEAHERGAVLVRAVFDAFLNLYTRHTADLVRLASGGSGILAQGALHPDLVERLAGEAATLAQQFFTRLVQAFDYLPPIDVTFEDFLRALVTVDLTLAPADERVRVALIEGFRDQGIFPRSAGSLGDEAVAWSRPSTSLTGVPVQRELLMDVIRDLDDDDAPGYARGKADEPGWARWRTELARFARDHHEALGLDRTAPITVGGMHPAVRRRENGRPTVDLVIRFLQERPDLVTPEMDGFVPTAGCTVVSDSSGVVRYAIAKPLPPRRRRRAGPQRATASAASAASAAGPDAAGEAGTGGGDDAAQRRLDELRARLEALARTDAGAAYRTRTGAERMRLRFALLHAGPDGEDEP